MDYKAFLKSSSKDPVVLPYFGGSRVDATDRRLRLDTTSTAATAPTPLELGWWRFEIDGRKAIPKDRAEAVDLGALPAKRGHWVDGWIVSSGRDVERVALPPVDEPSPLSRVTGRRWYSSDLVLDSIDFEDEAELEARRALEELRPIANLRHVVPSLRAAFGYALGLALGRQLGVRISLRELTPYIVAIADRGRDGMTEIVARIEEQRRLAEEAVRARMQVEELMRRQKALRESVAAARPRQRRGPPCERADEALAGANARMVNCRRLNGDQLVVTFTCDGVRIIATVDADSLNVIDAGFCLAGADRELTLDSLPSTVREAIEEDHLNITRHD